METLQGLCVACCYFTLATRHTALTQVYLRLGSVGMQKKHSRHTSVTSLFTIDDLTPGNATPFVCVAVFFCFFFATEPARFSVVVPDLFARAPQKYFCRKLCVYLMCVTGAGEMAGIMGFIYVHTHLLCPVSGTLTRGTHSRRDTSLEPPRIERAFTSRGVSQRDSAN